MTTDEEIRALREEVAKLRERVAVLEGAQYRPVAPMPTVWHPATGAPWEPPYTVTCRTRSAGVLKSKSILPGWLTL